MTEMIRIDKRGGNRARHEVRPMPDDFAQQAKDKNRSQLVKHYRTSDKAVGRWIDESGFTPRRTVNRLVPDNWEQLCAVHTAAELTRLLVADIKVIKRWIAETKIEPVPFDRKGIIPVNRKPKSERAFKVMGSPHKAIINTRPRSIWDDAADVLRAERWVVYRCDEKGKADQKGRYWRAGMVILTPDSLLEKADKYRRSAA